jgi:hypothetical protein
MSYAQSINAIPSSGSYLVIVDSPGAEIKIQFARLGGALWLGKSQFERVSSAIFEAAGRRLISTAIERLRAGETLVWHHNSSILQKKKHGQGIQVRY